MARTGQRSATSRSLRILWRSGCRTVTDTELAALVAGLLQRGHAHHTSTTTTTIAINKPCMRHGDGRLVRQQMMIGNGNIVVVAGFHLMVGVKPSATGSAVAGVMAGVPALRVSGCPREPAMATPLAAGGADQYIYICQ